MPLTSIFCVEVVYVVVQFYPWFKFYFPLFWGMVISAVIYDNEFETRENKIKIKYKIEPLYICKILLSDPKRQLNPTGWRRLYNFRPFLCCDDS